MNSEKRKTPLMQNILKVSFKHAGALLKLEKKERPSETANDPLLVLVSVYSCVIGKHCWPTS